MKISQLSVSALEKIISGNETRQGTCLAPYRSGPDLVNFFNQYGPKEYYGAGFPSRWEYTESKIKGFNGTNKLKLVIEGALDPRHFLSSEYELKNAVSYLNDFLKFDGYELRLIGKVYRIRELGHEIIQVDSPILQSGGVNSEFIFEQLKKCEQKLADGDNDGAITNARSLLESVLISIEKGLTGEEVEYDGNLNKLYKRVQRLLDLEPKRQDISNSLRQVLTGLVSIINGLASLRNQMSDAHARSYKPGKRHAKLVVNASHTACDFLLDTFEYQVKSGIIKLQSKTKTS